MDLLQTVVHCIYLSTANDVDNGEVEEEEEKWVAMTSGQFDSRYHCVWCDESNKLITCGGVFITILLFRLFLLLLLFCGVVHGLQFCHTHTQTHCQKHKIRGEAGKNQCEFIFCACGGEG